MARLLPCGTFVVDVCGEMTWPAPTTAMADLGWRLRYNPDSITESDRLTIASVISAYMQIVSDPTRKRNRVVAEIKAALKSA